MIYLYGLLDGDAAATDPFPNGVTGPVLQAPLPQGVLLYGDHDGADILPRRRSLLAHARVLDHALEQGNVLPMRFGMVADGLDAVRALIAAEATQIEAEKARLTGLVEMGLRVTYEKSAALTHQLSRHSELAAEHATLSGSGSPPYGRMAKFGERLGAALDQHRSEAQRALLGLLRPHVEDINVRVPEDEAQILAADLLLSRTGEAQFVAQLNACLASIDFVPGHEPAIRLVGPTPPFNFVRLSLAPQSEAA